jgi:cell surface protein SprA
MIGVRNNDIKPHCAQVWVNELRVNGFDEKGGYAGLARMEVKLADLGRLNLATNFTSIGWGSLEQRLAERQREKVLQYDGAIEIQLGKFLPATTGKYN